VPRETQAEDGTQRSSTSMKTIKATYMTALAVAGVYGALPGNVNAQPLRDLYRLGDGVSRSHVEQHIVSLVQSPLEVGVFADPMAK
jgi:hypothetical protein